MKLKQCSQCREFKPETAEFFCKSKQSKNGLRSPCRVCKSKNDKEYRQRNRSELLEKRRQYYLKNRDTFSKKNKIYREKNKDKIRKMKRAYSKTPKGREMDRVKCQRYQARKKRLLSTFTSKQWMLCKAYFEHSCAYCGKESSKLHQEHFIPVANRGRYTVTNIIPACQKCNQNKQDRDFFDWYPEQPFYSKARESRILKYLNYDKQGHCQQLSIFDTG